MDDSQEVRSVRAILAFFGDKIQFSCPGLSALLKESGGDDFSTSSSEKSSAGGGSLAVDCTPHPSNSRVVDQMPPGLDMGLIWTSYLICWRTAIQVDRFPDFAGETREWRPQSDLEGIQTTLLLLNLDVPPRI